MNNNHLITLTEAAKMLGIHKQTFYRNFREWGVPYHRIGKLYRFDKERLGQWLRENESSTGGPPFRS